MKNVLIVNISDTGNEGEAIRQVLERMNFLVCVKSIGRPNDFIDVLQGKIPFDFDYVILSCHGIDGQICMPVLGENIYFENEPRKNFSADDVSKFIKISGKIVINLGCTTGEFKMAHVFSEKNIYIAPEDYVDGDATLFFVIRLFYELKKGNNLKNAFKIARESDKETLLFGLFQED